jgi:hypothetical protein
LIRGNTVGHARCYAAVPPRDALPRGQGRTHHSQIATRLLSDCWHRTIAHSTGMQD